MKKANFQALNIRLHTEHLEQLQAHADREFLSLSDIVRQALREWLALKAKTNIKEEQHVQ